MNIYHSAQNAPDVLPANSIVNADCFDVFDKVADASIDMILCDLPYGTTACKWDTVLPFDKLWAQYKRVIKINGVILLFGNEPFTSLLVTSNLQMFKYRVTWDKGRGSGFLNAKKMPMTRVEDICIFSASKNGRYAYNPILTKKPTANIRPKKNKNPSLGSTYGATNGKLSDSYDNSKDYPTNLITQFPSYSAECNSMNRQHPTQKPIALFKYLIETYTNAGMRVLDNCAGSGTTGAACIELGREFILIEKESGYFNDTIIPRLTNAIATQNSKLFNEIKK